MMRRQVPFSPIVISLMGDEPETIDPVIVLSCIILEDETSETQVGGIVTKVREPSSHIYSVRQRQSACPNECHAMAIGTNQTKLITQTFSFLQR
jgi:hypothetical protein